MCFLILLEKVTIVRKTASHLPQVGWMNYVSLEERKGCLPSGGPIQGVWPKSLETRARKFPARGLGWLQQPVSPQGNGSLCYCCPKREGSGESTVEPDPPRTAEEVRTRSCRFCDWGDWMFLAGKGGVPVCSGVASLIQCVCPRIPAFRGTWGALWTKL